MAVDPLLYRFWQCVWVCAGSPPSSQLCSSFRPPSPGRLGNGSVPTAIRCVPPPTHPPTHPHTHTHSPAYLNPPLEHETPNPYTACSAGTVAHPCCPTSALHTLATVSATHPPCAVHPSHPRSADSKRLPPKTPRPSPPSSGPSLSTGHGAMTMRAAWSACARGASSARTARTGRAKWGGRGTW